MHMLVSFFVLAHSLIALKGDVFLFFSAIYFLTHLIENISGRRSGLN